MIYIYENLPIFAYFFKRREDFSRPLKKNPTFSNIFPRAKHVLNTFKSRRLCVRLYLFVVNILLAPVISTSTHRCVNNSPDTKVLMKVIETETFNVDFTSLRRENFSFIPEQDFIFARVKTGQVGT